MVVAYHDGTRLDLGEMIREQLFLSVPDEEALPRGLQGPLPAAAAPT